MFYLRCVQMREMVALCFQTEIKEKKVVVFILAQVHVTQWHQGRIYLYVPGGIIEI